MIQCSGCGCPRNDDEWCECTEEVNDPTPEDIEDVNHEGD